MSASEMRTYAGMSALEMQTYGSDFGIETVTSAQKTALGSPRSASVFAKFPIDRVTIP